MKEGGTTDLFLIVPSTLNHEGTIENRIERSENSFKFGLGYYDCLEFCQLIIASQRIPKSYYLFDVAGVCLFSSAKNVREAVNNCPIPHKCSPVLVLKRETQKKNFHLAAKISRNGKYNPLGNVLICIRNFVNFSLSILFKLSFCKNMCNCNTCVINKIALLNKQYYYI